MDGRTFDGLTRMVAGERSRRSLLKGIGAGVAVVAAGRFGVRPAAAASEPADIVTQYYDALQKHAYQTAYRKLGSALQAAQPYADFVAGFADTAFTAVEVTGVKPALGNNYIVSVKVKAWLSDGTPQQFVGTYGVGRDQGHSGPTRIVDAKLRVADAELPALCAADQLSATVTGDSATGHRYATITVTNGGDACVLGGMPGVLVKDAYGHTLIRGKREGNTAVTWVELEPQAIATLQLNWTNWCGSKVSDPVSATVTLPGSTGSFTVNNAIGVPPCLGDAGSASHLSVRPWLGDQNI